MKIANLFSDKDILKAAQKTAKDIIKKDPTLSCEKNKGIKNKVNEMFREEIVLN